MRMRMMTRSTSAWGMRSPPTAACRRDKNSSSHLTMTLWFVWCWLFCVPKLASDFKLYNDVDEHGTKGNFHQNLIDQTHRMRVKQKNHLRCTHLFKVNGVRRYHAQSFPPPFEFLGLPLKYLTLPPPHPLLSRPQVTFPLFPHSFHPKI